MSAKHRARFIALMALVIWPSFLLNAQTDDSLGDAVEAARRTRDEAQLQSLKAQLTERTNRDAKDARSWYELARVQGYLVDVYHARKDKKSASASVDAGIEAAQRSIQLNETSADVHSLLADLYGRRISLGGFTAGPRFGPKVKEENKRALAIDDKNPHAWASTGRQYLMTPSMFGGDTDKAIESFLKSLALNPQQDETYVWLAKAYEKQGDKPKARNALKHALQINPQNAFAAQMISAIGK